MKYTCKAGKCNWTIGSVILQPVFVVISIFRVLGSVFRYVAWFCCVCVCVCRERLHLLHFQSERACCYTQCVHASNVEDTTPKKERTETNTNGDDMKTVEKNRQYTRNEKQMKKKKYTTEGTEATTTTWRHTLYTFKCSSTWQKRREFKHLILMISWYSTVLCITLNFDSDADFSTKTGFSRDFCKSMQVWRSLETSSQRSIGRIIFWTMNSMNSFDILERF